MTYIRTEYAIRYTDHPDSAPSAERDLSDTTDLARAKALLAHIRDWQASTNGRLPVDAELVSRTITTSDWQAT